MARYFCGNLDSCQLPQNRDRVLRNFGIFQIFLTFTKIVGIINPILAIIRKLIVIFLTFAKITGIIK